jgi:hypothetical protein
MKVTDSSWWSPYLQEVGQPAAAYRVHKLQAEEDLCTCVVLTLLPRLAGLSKLREYLVNQTIVVQISLEWLRTLLIRCGIKWRRTKTWKESRDPEFWPKYRRIRRLYARRPAGGRRICIDEFGPLNLQPQGGMCWAKRGAKRVDRHRATYHRHGGVRHFLAAYDLETGRLFGIFTHRKRWNEFLTFLKWLRRRYDRQETLHIVMDNYSPHLKQVGSLPSREILSHTHRSLLAQSARVSVCRFEKSSRWTTRIIELTWSCSRQFKAIYAGAMDTAKSPSNPGDSTRVANITDP